MKKHPHTGPYIIAKFLDNLGLDFTSCSETMEYCFEASTLDHYNTGYRSIYIGTNI